MLKELQVSIAKKSFKLKELCPYPFDHTIATTPFPKNFEIHKFDKYKWKGDPHNHVKELSHFERRITMITTSLFCSLESYGGKP